MSLPASGIPIGINSCITFHALFLEEVATLDGYFDRSPRSAKFRTDAGPNLRLTRPGVELHDMDGKFTGISIEHVSLALYTAILEAFGESVKPAEDPADYWSEVASHANNTHRRTWRDLPAGSVCLENGGFGVLPTIKASFARTPDEAFWQKLFKAFVETA